MQFFEFFPQTRYEFDVNGTRMSFDITVPTTRLKIMQKLQQTLTVFYDYVIQDGQRPDSVATDLYGSPAYTWIILLVNNIQSLYDWPLATEEFHRYILEKFGSLAAAESEWLYYTADGYLVDVMTYNGLIVADRGTPKTAYQYELELNEAKRRIKVIPAEFASPLLIELKKVFD